MTLFLSYIPLFRYTRFANKRSETLNYFTVLNIKAKIRYL